MDLRAAVADERRHVAGLVASLRPDQLDTPSLCGDWTVKQVAGHLLAAGDGSLPSLGMVVRNGFRLHKVNAALAVHKAERPADELAQALRATADTVSPAPLIGYPGQLTDLQVHGQDMRRPLGLPHELRPELLRVSLDFVTGGKAYGFTPRRRPAGLRFEASDLTWSSGVGALVTGPAEALLLALCGRSVVLEELDGPGVRVLRDRLR